MLKNYPIMLRLEGKRAVVVGGGKVAEQKVGSLIGTGAEIVVISPEVTEELERLAAGGTIKWKKKSYSEDDIQGAFLVFAATNDKTVNHLVSRSADAHQLVNIVDNPQDSDFHVPSHFERGRLSIAVSTGGASPSLAKKLREQLEAQYDETYEEYLEFLFSAREWIKREVKDPGLKRRLLTAIVSEEFLTSENRDADLKKLFEEWK